MRSSEMQCSRFSVIAFEPPGRDFVSLHRPLLVPDLHFIDLRQILLMCCRSSKVPLHRVVSNGLLQHTGRIFGVSLAVDLERFGEGIRRIVGLVELFRLY